MFRTNPRSYRFSTASTSLLPNRATANRSEEHRRASMRHGVFFWHLPRRLALPSVPTRPSVLPACSATPPSGLPSIHRGVSHRLVSPVLCTLLGLFFSQLMAWSATEVEAEGRAPGDSVSSRELALADALREAVRLGVGVDVAAATSVQDFALDYDRILSSAFGHVETYQVVTAGLGADQIYRVKIKAQVTKGTPRANRLLALRHLLIRKGAPRVAIAVSESLDGAAGTTQHAQGLLEQLARELQIYLVDVGMVRDADQKRARRDEIFGAETEARLRQRDVTQKVDFLIEGSLICKYLGQESLYGSLPQHVFSAGGQLRVLRPETGEIVVSLALPGNENLETPLESKEIAARDVIQQLLKKGRTPDELPQLMSQLLSRWITECDLGTLKRVEFSGIDHESFRDITTSLSDTPLISAAWTREFDARGLSILDVETRLDTASLISAILQTGKGSVSLERHTDNFLAFQASGAQEYHSQGTAGTSPHNGDAAKQPAGGEGTTPHASKTPKWPSFNTLGAYSRHPSTLATALALLGVAALLRHYRKL